MRTRVTKFYGDSTHALSANATIYPIINAWSVQPAERVHMAAEPSFPQCLPRGGCSTCTKTAPDCGSRTSAMAKSDLQPTPSRPPHTHSLPSTSPPLPPPHPHSLPSAPLHPSPSLAGRYPHFGYQHHRHARGDRSARLRVPLQLWSAWGWWLR